MSGFDVALFGRRASPRHQRNLEQELGEKRAVLDRTALILDIFAQHAHTREGALQVELAQYEYRLPRLTRGWTHLVRQAGGGAGRSGTAGVGLRGPGETQLEVDRRQIRSRIAFKKELKKAPHRQQHRSRRAQFRWAIVGYTNGQSSLLNALVDGPANTVPILAEDKLFATLDPTTRRVRLPAGKVALFTNTVGFIQNCRRLVGVSCYTGGNHAPICCCTPDITHPNALEGLGSGADAERTGNHRDSDRRRSTISMAAPNGDAERAISAQASLGVEATESRSLLGRVEYELTRTDAGAAVSLSPLGSGVVVPRPGPRRPRGI
jgi:GTP-binding protein HflX